MINDLKILVNFLDKAKIDHLEIFNQNDFNTSKSKVGKLFEIIKENNFSDFKELQEATYGEIASESAFKKLIFRFKEKLINTLFFADVNSPLFSERTRAYYISSRRTLSIRMIVERGARRLAIEIAENTLPICLKYEFTELSVLLSRFLLRQYSGNVMNTKKYLSFKKTYGAQVKIYNAELEMEEISSAIIFKRNATSLIYNKKNSFKLLDTEVEKAILFSQENPSIELILSCSTIILDYYKELKNFSKYKEWTFYFAERIFSKPFLSIVTLENLLNAQLRITLLTKDAKTADEIEFNFFQKLINGNFNWYVVNLYYILTLLHCKKFVKATYQLEFVIGNKTFGNQPAVIQENYFICQAYCSYLNIIGITERIKNQGEFRINKFLNQVPEFSRDKQGANIPILIIQILFFLADKKYSKIIDRIESLNLYSYRHLKKDENFRSQCFIRMISEMVRADFRKQGTIFRTEKLLTKLKAVPIDMYPATAETEIIPYEDLWEMVVERLE